MPNRRPFRDKIEEKFDGVPSGPLDKTGGGTLAGAAGFLAVESSKPFFGFIPGVKQPGYKVTAHSTEKRNGFVEHTITIAAVSRDVAEFVAKYTAAASNVDFVTQETEIREIEEVQETRTYSIWRIHVLVDERGRRE